MSNPETPPDAALADRAVAGDPVALPEEWLADRDAVLAAFAHYQAGRDEESVSELRKVGVRSPFAEWKLLLRGLSAWSRGEDGSALDNWRRLDPDRLPARLVAPLRSAAEPAFREAQSPAVRDALDGRYSKLVPGDAVLMRELRSIRAELLREERLDRAFRSAKKALPRLRKNHPGLADRLASCLYWAIRRHGKPEDLGRYSSAFGPPPDDPEFARLEAMVMESLGDLESANRFWERYSDRLPAGEPWPPDDFALARAMIAHRMGKNAQEHLSRDTMAAIDELGEMLGIRVVRPRKPLPLKPTAEECFRRASDLAPGWAEPAVSLMRLYVQRGEHAEAARFAPTLRARFPNHPDALEAIARHFELTGRPADAAEVLGELHRVDPFDRKTLFRIGWAHLAQARIEGEQGRFDAARGSLRRSLEHLDGVAARVARCTRAAIELASGNEAEAQRQLAAAEDKPDAHASVAYLSLVEVIRFKLPRTVKQRFDEGFASVLDAGLSPLEAAALLQDLGLHRHDAKPYRGLKTHAKKVKDAVKQTVQRNAGDEPQWVALGLTLLRTEEWKLLEDCAAQGMRLFPENPHFPWLLAEPYFGSDRRNYPSYRVIPLLRKAERLAERIPTERRAPRLLERIRERLREVTEDDPFWFPDGDEP